MQCGGKRSATPLFIAGAGVWVSESGVAHSKGKSDILSAQRGRLSLFRSHVFYLARRFY
jgi:hypothetical protein